MSHCAACGTRRSDVAERQAGVSTLAHRLTHTPETKTRRIASLTAQLAREKGLLAEARRLQAEHEAACERVSA